VARDEIGEAPGRTRGGRPWVLGVAVRPGTHRRSDSFTVDKMRLGGHLIQNQSGPSGGVQTAKPGMSRILTGAAGECLSE